MTDTNFHDDLQTAHILMVDDDKEDLFLTKVNFEQSKFPFKFTGLDSAEALFDYVKRNGMKDVDILLLDLNMPDVNGLDALKKLPQPSGDEHIKRFMYSTSTRIEDKKRCIDAGADGYLFKPSNSQDVKKFVNTVALASNFWV